MRCEIICSPVFTQDGITLCAYGIAVEEDDRSVYYNDLSFSRHAVERLRKILAENDIAPEHVGDIVEDFIEGDSRAVNCSAFSDRCKT